MFEPRGSDTLLALTLALRLSCLLACAGCSTQQTADPPAAPAPPPAPPVALLSAHAGATALWHDGGLWVSEVRDWDRPARIRLSRGDGPVQHELRGWVAGVRDGKAYVATPSGDSLAVQRVDVDGRADTLTTIPAPAGGYRYALAVTSTGEVAVSGGSEHAVGVRILGGAGEPRRCGSEPVEAIAADPFQPRIAALGGTTTRVLTIHDATTCDPLRTVELGGARPADEGELAYDDDGAVWVHADRQIQRIGAAHQRHLVGAHISARNLVFARDGGRIAFTTEVGTGHMLPSGDPACLVHAVRTDETLEQFARDHSVQRFAGGCYFGLGLAFVAGTLWVAPPASA